MSNYDNVANWRVRNKLRLIEYKGGKCEICGYNKCLAALTFHHRDPSKKEFSISTKNRTLERNKEEVDKCILLCCRCHAEEHEKLQIEKIGKRSPVLKRYIIPVKICQVCNKEFKPFRRESKTCSIKCRGISRRKTIRPAKHEIIALTETMSFVDIGKKYGVSDNAVRKWIKNG